MRADLSRQSFAVRYVTLFAGEVFSKLCVMLAFAYMARVLDPRAYGIVELALSITVFFVLGVESGMGLYGARVVAATPERIPRLVSEVMLLRALLGIPALAAMLAIAVWYRDSGLGLLAVNAVAVLLTPFLSQWVFQGLRQMQWVAVGSVVRSVVFAALVVFLIRAGSDVRLAAAAEVGGIAALALTNAVFLFGRLGVRLDGRDLVARTRTLFHDVWYMGISDFTWACQWYAPAIVLGGLGLNRTEQVAWLAASVRIVISVHTFVWLYFFNLLPNLAKELATSIEGWRELMQRSVKTSLWPATLLAIGGTFLAPWALPLLYGPAYEAAVLPFQIVIWMIPVAWFSGHFRFSLIAAGQQRWEFVASAATALVTVALSFALGAYWSSVGAAAALLAGGIANTALAYTAMSRQVGSVSLMRVAAPAVASTLVAGAVGAGALRVVHPVLATTAACIVHLAIALRQDNELVALGRRWLGR